MNTEQTKQTEKTDVISIKIFILFIPILLIELIKWLDWTNSLVYKPAHELFGDSGYLDFYLGRGVPAVYLFICFIVATIVGVRLLIRCLHSDTTFMNQNKTGWTYVFFYIVTVIITFYSCYKFLPDLSMALDGKYVTIESDNFEVSRTYIKGRRKSLGYYEYTVSIYDSIGDKEFNLMDQNLAYMNDRYLERGIKLTISPYLYNKLKSVKSYDPFRISIQKEAYDSLKIFEKDGRIDMSNEEVQSILNEQKTKRVSTQEYMVIQFHYLPKTNYLLSYTIVSGQE